jgi:3-dehydroquinate synthase
VAEAIERSCANKADVVAADEREGGVRAILNFGHTFGHAIESAQGYGSWLHGEAVAAGMVLATRLSMQELGLPGEELAPLLELLRESGLPIDPPADMSAAQFLEYMQRDKKVMDGRLRLILLEAVGRAVVNEGISRQTLLDFLSQAR